MVWRDVGFYVRGRVNRGLSRLVNRRRGAPLVPLPLAEVLAGDGSPIGLSRLVGARANAEREAAVAWYLQARGITFARHRFATFEGRGENFSVDLGGGERVLLLIAHHDAVLGSPGANDNAAAVGILLHLIGRIAVPAGLTVRLLFTAAEERGYLGARAYVAQQPLQGLVGVLSLELCGIGDSLVLWDAGVQTPFLTRMTAALEGIGLRRDDRYHVVGRIPLFGSDHRAFTASGVPAHGLTVVPASEADALRRFIFNPWRSSFRQFVRRPRPFDTYHTRHDSLDTLEPGALEAVARALEAIVAELG